MRALLERPPPGHQRGGTRPLEGGLPWTDARIPRYVEMSGGLREPRQRNPRIRSKKKPTAAYLLPAANELEGTRQADEAPSLHPSTARSGVESFGLTAHTTA